MMLFRATTTQEPAAPEAAGQATDAAMAAIPDWVEALGLGGAWEWLATNPSAAVMVGLFLLGFAAWIALVVVRPTLVRAVAMLVRRTPTWWDEVLLDREVFHRLSWVVPIFVVFNGIQHVPFLPDGLATLIQRLALASFAIVAVRVFIALLAGVNEIYSRYDRAKDRPIKGYLQVVTIIAYFAAGLYIVATLIGRNPAIFLGGLGAMTAVLMLIFRDTLLSLMAGVQITGNNLIRVGDWIEMPQFGADGDVIDIALNSVTVQNWDRTLTMIPTHKFLDHSFKNWRGMSESGGRRIKRSLYMDMTTIRFLTDEEEERFGRFVLLKDYIVQKKAELEVYNRQHATDPEIIANARRLTNIGTFRRYVINYLKQHPKVRQDMIQLVRQLQPTPDGLPLEVYCFTADTAWIAYEGIQSDIFDHLFAVVGEFGLRVFQEPSGHDVALAAEAVAASAARAGGDGSLLTAPGGGSALGSPDATGKASKKAPAGG